MLFGNEVGQRSPTNLDEDIVTAEDYLDDAEEETAQRINKKKDEQQRPGSGDGQSPEYSEDMNESAIEQILEDEDGNLYVEDADGNLIPYELPGHLQNVRIPKSPES
jgi:hypothetical protein